MSTQSGGPFGTIAVRPGDALDMAALTVWLHANTSELLGAGTGALRLAQFGGGFSNLTFLVEGGAAPMVLRRPPHGVGRGVAHDVQREYRVLLALHAAGVPVPRPLAMCADDTVIGAPFFLMEHVDGVILRQAAPGGVQFGANTASAVARSFVEQLAALHARSVSTLGLGALGKGDGYVARQVAGWTARWEHARTRPVAEIDELAAWLARQQPADAGVALLHNDFKYDNLVLDPLDLTHVRAILDWEMATVGCPLMDLGTSLAYWVEADDPPLLRAFGLGITAGPGSPSRTELAAMYAETAGRALGDPLFYYAYGLFKLAVVAQQIASRYERGLTSDPRFARLGEAVQTLGRLGVNALETGRIGRA